VLEGAPIQAWSVYSHPDPRYRGVWLQSKQAEYHLGAPSSEYAPLAEGFAECVRHAVAVHLFVTDVLGVADADDAEEQGQGLGLDMLLELMAGTSSSDGSDGGLPLDRAFVEANATILYDLLRGLNLGGSLQFMKDVVRWGLVCLLFHALGLGHEFTDTDRVDRSQVDCRDEDSLPNSGETAHLFILPPSLPPSLPFSSSGT
jgi:hypothetical protein